MSAPWEDTIESAALSLEIALRAVEAAYLACADACREARIPWSYVDAKQAAEVAKGGV